LFPASPALRVDFFLEGNSKSVAGVQIAWHSRPRRRFCALRARKVEAHGFRPAILLPSMRRLLLLLILVLLIVGWALSRSGDFLVVNRPEKADVIVVLAGDLNDVRYWRGLALLQSGYAHQLLLDASSDYVKYGRTYAATAADFVRARSGELADRARVCPIQGNSTVTETRYVVRCLEELRARKVLLVTSDYHTRRALSVFARRLPQYRWSVAAAGDPRVFGTRWWTNREWAKMWLIEWQRLVWWKLVDRWR
jgi:uncharacterized SAM-binding protein YcdF (DUF218 family)